MHLTTEITHAGLVHKFVLWLCQELQVFPDSISIHGEDDLDGVYGLCMDVTESEFVILVKTGKRNIGEIFTTIAHEMIHVKQYMKENLGHWMDSCSDIPYKERWWEVEAFAESIPLVEKFAKEL
jgi:hypothetical protein